MVVRGTIQVWVSRGRGLEPGPRFEALEEAIEFVEQRSGDMMYGVRLADGRWHRWPDGLCMKRASDPARMRRSMLG